MLQPEKGFYYHYGHDPKGPVNNCVYEVLGNAFNTESPGDNHSEDPTDFLHDEMTVYRPLFSEALVYKTDKRFWIRLTKMFCGSIVKNGISIPRFTKIADEKIIAELSKIRDELYF